MPTYNRRPFVPRAIAWFQRQDHPNAELVIVDDGDEAVGDLVPDDARIRYIRLDGRETVGRKRNLACEAARGDFVMHWDDDDWYAADRIRRQLAVFEQDGVDVCGAAGVRFYDVAAARAWTYTYPTTARRWVYGATLAYRRDYWNGHRFSDIDVGEDSTFVWAADPKRVAVIEDGSFYLGAIHTANVSPKQTDGAMWEPFPVAIVEAQLGGDLQAFADPPRRIAAHAAPARALRNVHACLVHEHPACVIDLVRNLRHCDPASEVLLYDGSATGTLLRDRAVYDRLGATVHPNPRPMRWGYLQDFAFDAMRFALDELRAEAMTVVDSDQLAVRAGYAGYAGAYLAAHGRAGLLAMSAEVQPHTTRVGPAARAWTEFARWQPLLRAFPRGEEHFVRWSFWPSTVFTAPAMRELVDLRDRSTQLRELLTGTTMWAIEEVLFPTLVGLLGYDVLRNPCTPELLRYKVPITYDELQKAAMSDSIYWVHPVERTYGDATRTRIRQRRDHYGSAAPSPPGASPGAGAPLRTLPILARMRTVHGWLTDDEADALIGLAGDAVRANARARIVEVGSYHGRATVVLASIAQVLDRTARVYAVDPHDGRLGTLDAIVEVEPSAGALARTIALHGLKETVVPIQSSAPDLAWNEPVDLLLVDGLHDYASVAADFGRFAPFVRSGSRVAFHDYSASFPGVCAFVDELRAGAEYRMVELIGTLAVLEKRTAGGV